MKTKLSLFILFIAALCFLPADTTNNATVVLTDYQESLLRDYFKYENGLRTNGLPPYGEPTNALSFKQFIESVAAAAIEVRLPAIKADREAKLLELWRAASPAKQAAAINALK